MVAQAGCRAGSDSLCRNLADAHCSDARRRGRPELVVIRADKRRSASPCRLDVGGVRDTNATFEGEHIRRRREPVWVTFVNGHPRQGCEHGIRCWPVDPAAPDSNHERSRDLEEEVGWPGRHEVAARKRFCGPCCAVSICLVMERPPPYDTRIEHNAVHASSFGAGGRYLSRRCPNSSRTWLSIASTVSWGPLGGFVSLLRRSSSANACRRRPSIRSHESGQWARFQRRMYVKRCQRVPLPQRGRSWETGARERSPAPPIPGTRTRTAP